MLKSLFAIKDVQLPGKHPFYQEQNHYIRNIIRISFVFFKRIFVILLFVLYECLFYAIQTLVFIFIPSIFAPRGIFRFNSLHSLTDSLVSILMSFV